MKNRKFIYVISFAAVFFIFMLSQVFAAVHEDADNISGYLVLLKENPSHIEILTENKDRSKYLWTQETIFVDWEENKLSPKDFFLKFKDKGVFLFLEGKTITRAAPAVF